MSKVNIVLVQDDSEWGGGGIEGSLWEARPL